MDCKEYTFNKSFESMLWQERNYKVYVSCLFPKMFNLDALFTEMNHSDLNHGAFKSTELSFTI